MLTWNNPTLSFQSPNPFQKGIQKGALRADMGQSSDPVARNPSGQEEGGTAAKGLGKSRELFFV